MKPTGTLDKWFQESARDVLAGPIGKLLSIFNLQGPSDFVRVDFFVNRDDFVKD